MKAKEYFEKYKDLISSENKEIAIKGTSDLVFDLFNEIDALCKVRGVKTDRGMITIIKEENSKWNAIAALFEKDYGDPMLVRNGFNKFMIHKIPELEKFLPA